MIHRPRVPAIAGPPLPPDPARSWDRAVPNAGRGPVMSGEEIEQRQQAAQATRAEHEAYWLQRERARHGDTIQTRVGPLSAMVI